MTLWGHGFGVPERDRHILRGQVEDVDHVPAGEVTRRQVEAPLPARRAPDCLPVVGARARGPVLAADRREAELSFDRQKGPGAPLADPRRQAKINFLAELRLREITAQ